MGIGNRKGRKKKKMEGFKRKKIATDGSFKEEKGLKKVAYGIIGIGGERMKSKVEGKQTIRRAEALGILSAAKERSREKENYLRCKNQNRYH